MNLNELTSRCRAGDVNELRLVSMEGDIYVLEARIGQRYHPIQDRIGHILTVRSVEQARQLLAGLPEVPFNLVHAVVYDEMCGMEGTEAGEGMPIPLH